MPDHYYKMKYAVSGRDLAWKMSTQQIQNGQFAAFIDLNMRNIYRTI